MLNREVYICVLLIAGGCFLRGGSGQALNAHINPRWVESGRELLARQGYRNELNGYQNGFQRFGGAQDYRGAGGYQGYSSSRPRLFYVDNSGQLRPVVLESGLQGTSQFATNNYRSQIGNTGLVQPNLYQTVQDPYLLK